MGINTDYTELINKLRSTKSESKRAMLDSAADAIEELLFERNKEVQIERRVHIEDLSDGALD